MAQPQYDWINNYLNPAQTPVAPTRQASVVPGMLQQTVQSGLGGFLDYLDKEKQRKIERATANLKNQQLQNDIDMFNKFGSREKEAEIGYKEGQTAKLSAEEQQRKTSEEMMKKLFSDIDAEQAKQPEYKPVKSWDDLVEEDAGFKEAKKILSFSAMASGNYGNVAKDLKKLKDESVSQLITSKFNDVVADRTKQKQEAGDNTPVTREEAYEIMKNLDEKNRMDNASYKMLLANFPTRQALQDAEFAKARDTRAADAAERAAANQGRVADQQQFANTIAERKEIQAQVDDFGKNMEDLQVPRLVSAYNGTVDAIASYGGKLDKNTQTALKALRATTDNVNWQTYLLNAIGGANPQDAQNKELLDKLANDANVKKAMTDPKFSALQANLFDLISADLRKTSGSAVTPTELQSFLVKLGLQSWDGNPDVLEKALDKYGRDLKQSLVGVQARYSPKAIEEFKTRGGVVPELKQLGQKPKPTKASKQEEAELLDLMGQ